MATRARAKKVTAAQPTPSTASIQTDDTTVALLAEQAKQRDDIAMLMQKAAAAEERAFHAAATAWRTVGCGAREWRRHAARGQLLV